MKTTVAVILVGVVVGSAILFVNKGNNSRTDLTQKEEENMQNVSIVDGKQIITIKAKGGYLPRVSVAKANMPTILRFDTSGTFDCSSTVRVPSMKISQVLPSSGSTDIDLGNPKLGILQGSCGMGMYPFEINFSS